MLTINQYFKNLIPPLSSDEFSQLEENILAHGCLDAIKLWRGTIIDGHNRYEICQKHGLPYKVKKLRFGTKKDATIWIIENQLGRRNLPKAVLIKLGLEKAKLLGHNIRKYASQVSGASEGVVYQYMKIVEHGDPKLLQQLERGELAIGRAYKELRGHKASSDSYRVNITKKTVEVLYESDQAPDIHHPDYAAAVASNIAEMESTYKYITEKSGLMHPGEGFETIRQRLHRQLAVVGRML